MDSDSIFLCGVLMLLFFICGAYFASLEMALSSINRLRIKSQSDDGDIKAKKVLYLINNFDKTLTTLLVGTNIMHIATATLGTLMATRLFGAAYVPAATLILTAAVLLFAETIPKSFGKDCSEAVAKGGAGLLLVIMKILYPLTVFFSWISSFVTRRFKRSAAEPTVTRDELSDIIGSIVEEGELEEDKGELVQSALEFSYTAVRDVLTPWAKTETVPADIAPDALMRVVAASGHSRLPVTDGAGKPIGVLRTRKFLKDRITGNTEPVSDMMDPARFVAEDMAIDDLLPVMSAEKTLMTLVMAADGSCLGVVTVEDILEELVGEIYDERDAELGMDEEDAE